MIFLLLRLIWQCTVHQVLLQRVNCSKVASHPLITKVTRLLPHDWDITLQKGKLYIFMCFFRISLVIEVTLTQVAFAVCVNCSKITSHPLITKVTRLLLQPHDWDITNSVSYILYHTLDEINVWYIHTLGATVTSSLQRWHGFYCCPIIEISHPTYLTLHKGY